MQPVVINNPSSIVVEKILSDGEEGGDGNYPGIYWVRKFRFDNPGTIGQTLTFVERLLDERLISRFTSSALNEDKHLMVADMGQTLVNGRAWLDRAEQIQAFDRAVEENPGVKKAMRAYWNNRYWESSGRAHGRISHDLMKNTLGDRVYISPRRDDLDLSISLGRGWVVEEVKKNTPVGQEVLKRIGKGYDLHWFLCDLSPSRTRSVIRTVAQHLGPQWRDPDGRNIAHSLMAQTNPIKRSALTSLAGMREFAGLFLTADNKGEAPLDMARRIRAWKDHQDLISKLARMAMLARASKNARPRRGPRSVRL